MRTVDTVAAETDVQSAVSPRIAWFSVTILLLVAIMSYLDRQIISLMVEPIKASLGVSDFEIGLLQGVAFGLFYAVFGLPIGWLVDRYSRRKIIYFGMTLWSLAAGACGLASTYTHLLLARFGVGVGEASLSPAAYSMIADLFPPRRLALALGVFATGSSIGGALAYMAGGALIAKFEAMGAMALPGVGVLEPWQLVFLVTGLPGVGIAALMFLVPEPVRRHRKLDLDAPDRGVMHFLLANRRYFICHFLGFGLVAVMAYGTAAWAPAMLMRRYGLGVAEVGIILGTIGALSGIPGFIFGGWFVDRWFARGQRDAHLRYFVYACLIGVAMAIIAFQLADGILWLFIPAYALLHFLQPFTGPAVAHLQIVTPNEYRGRISALFVLVFNLMGMCLGPPSVAFITTFVLHDPMQVHWSLTIMYVVVGLCAATLFRLALAPARRAAEAVA
ncbi:MFS transporter [Sphingomonas koreensis]|jgi:MFS family permease|uniref:MFS transporter n=1 Tax=Sphingomonas koreensis TaxID=93064 RepID=A0AAJ4S1S5_9SPHN|nr:MFS transporter [Sphingomonas koreensis]MDC7810570.1 MFS transporter [Sphingomonas koreensis]RSU17739.1 MFS transporter [Sphingomonas koreensis]RSU21985.1 MFS transporter [Sphingomonas koreensis]RSU23129.1 MFS transporter [Sphingomonas koreensis]RSU31701.1 MFS transporter [Sphingomonas koreensis]